MGSTLRVTILFSLAMGSLAVGCGDDGDAVDGGNGLPPDAGADATPVPGAIVRLTPDRSLAPAGEDVTVVWTSELATSCTVTTSTGDSATGTSGQLVVTVEAPTRVIAKCEPPGAAAGAVIELAITCDGETVVDSLTLLDGEILDGDLNPLEVRDGTCIVVTGNMLVNGARAEHAARVREVGGRAVFFHGEQNGLDFIALETVGTLGMDYQNGVFPVEELGMSYLAFPSLSTIVEDDPPILLASGRADLRALDAFGIQLVTYDGFHDGVDAIDVSDGTVLDSVVVSNTGHVTLPMFLGRVAGVTGDVQIMDNPGLSHAEAETFVAALGQIDGTLTICGNLDDDPCN